MTISTQFEKAISKIGVLFARASDSAEDYLSLDSLSGSTPSWVRNFVRPFMIKADTDFENGDIVICSIDLYPYLITGLNDDMLIGQSAYKFGNLLKCNVVGTLASSITTRDSQTLQKTEIPNIIEGNAYGLLTDLRVDLLNTQVGMLEKNEKVLYLSDSFTIKPLYTYSTIATVSEEFRIKTVELNSVIGCNLLTVIKIN